MLSFLYYKNEVEDYICSFPVDRTTNIDVLKMDLSICWDSMIFQVKHEKLILRLLATYKENKMLLLCATTKMVLDAIGILMNV